MNIILLCAGYATRLRPLTDNQPKPLLPIGDKPMLEWILDRVKEISGVEAAYAVTNHKFAGHFQKWSEQVKYPWPIKVVDDQTTSNETRLGAIGDLYYVLTSQKVPASDMIVLAGDNLFDFDLKAFVEEAKSKKPHGVLATFDVKDRELAKQYGLVKLAGDGQITEFYEKPKDPPTTLASCGIYWLPAETRVFLDRYIREGHNADQPGHFMRWLAENDKLYGACLKGRWYDIGDLESYNKANSLASEFQKNP